MWLRIFKPLIFSLLITALFQAGIFCLGGYFSFNYSLLLLIIFLILVLGILLTYRSCAVDRQCRLRTRFIVFAIPPLFLFVGLSGFLFFNTDFYLREIFLILSAAAYFVIFSEIFSPLRNPLHDGVKFLTIFLLYNSILELVRYYQLSIYLIFPLVLLVTLLCLHHMFWRLKALKLFYSLISLGAGTILGLFALISAWFWPIASYFTLTIMVVALYYIAWGILHHHIDLYLTKKIVLDYVLIGAFVFIMALGLTFLTR